MIIVVTGGIAVGKTHWIREQIAKQRQPSLYFSPQTETFPIDRLILQSEFPQLSCVSREEEDRLSSLSAKNTVYMEVPWYLDPESLESFLKPLNCHRVAITSPEAEISEGQVPVDEIVFSPVKTTIKGDQWLKKREIQIYRAVLTGEVLDFSSLTTFWTELTQGAYGEVLRVKSIFDIIDGQCIYGEFRDEWPEKDFQSLNLPLNLDGRPNRFSGIEIVGRNLDKPIIADTLSDCCLSDEALFYYQQQFQESLEPEMELI
ncbi:hypothetical protein [Microcystis aeruginosa]|uniref:Signal recognition particle GTPase n=1 Tax=Microcystis aeruginosa FD4 TaxID=2686288 RepID=A0A857D6W1_MICAE|nr:hypothetical protein [Microcystis aeruginosa]NCR06899.1 hypothetical protein [Microcystis aeruginosa LG13-11]QGZ91196.1 hypothetical protein GQR42_18485 [Microcystis aeruginosa FD4]